MRLVKKIVPLVLLVTLILIVINVPRFIKIDSIICRSQYGQCSEIVQDKLASIEGNRLDKVNKSVKSSLKNEILVSNYSSQFRLPSTLEVSILERKPRFALTSKDKNLYANVDSEGRVLSLSQTTLLPFLIIDSIPSQGDLVKKQELFAMKIMYDMYITFQIKEGKLEKESLIINFPKGQTAIFPLDGDREVLVGSAILLINKLDKGMLNLAKNGENIDTIDLRFKNPVLK